MRRKSALSYTHEYAFSKTCVALLHYTTATRKYVGEMTEVGESVAITGVTKSKDSSLTDEEMDIGYFNMIDATEERLGEDKKGGTQQQQQSMGY